MRLVTGVLSVITAVLGAQAQERDRPSPERSVATETKRQADGELAKQILAELSEEELESFREAVNKVWNAEEVEKRRKQMQEANLAYRTALHSEVRKLETSEKMRTVLLKLMKLRYRQDSRPIVGSDRINPNVQTESRPPRPEADRRILNAARLKAEKTPPVIEAKRNVDKAVTQREKNFASGKYREVMRRAMIQADPRVERIFQRSDRPRPIPEKRTGEKGTLARPKR